MAHTKSKGTTSLGRDSQAKRLGVKLFDGQSVKAGGIIVRQRGTKFYPGLNVRRASDDTLYAVKNGYVKFSRKKKIRFNNNFKWIKLLNVIPEKLKERK